MATYAQLNTNVRNQCVSQLRTFDKTIQWTVQATVQNGQSGTTRRDQALYHRFEYVNANSNVYNNYLDSGIYSGNIINDNDVIDSITRIVRRTVDLIEGRITNRSSTFSMCHASCHTSCHTSRGRR
jgi:hypothetical protein